MVFCWSADECRSLFVAFRLGGNLLCIGLEIGKGNRVPSFAKPGEDFVNTNV